MISFFYPQSEDIRINRKITALILFIFLITFAISRLTVYLVVDHLIPDFFLTVNGVHIHHYAYGVIILAISGLYYLLRRPTPGTSSFRFLTVFYGVGLGLTFDEFAMWIRLEDEYWVRQSYDAIIIIGLILLNMLYYRWLIHEIKAIVDAVRQF